MARGNGGARLDTLRLVGPAGSNKVVAGALSRVGQRALGLRAEPLRKVGVGELLFPFSVELAATAVTCNRTSARVLMNL